MNKKTFFSEVKSGGQKLNDEYPRWRKGQSIFNYVDMNYDTIARQVQFEDGIDCFYNDDYIPAFLEACWERIKLQTNEE